MGNRAGRAGAPNTVNSSVRTREYLTVPEVERLMAAARKYSRYGHRDATMILISFRHGLRASETVRPAMAPGRVGRRPPARPQGQERLPERASAARRRNTRSAAPAREQGPSSHVFMTERDGPMTPKAFHALFGRIARRNWDHPNDPHRRGVRRLCRSRIGEMGQSGEVRGCQTGVILLPVGQSINCVPRMAALTGIASWRQSTDVRFRANRTSERTLPKAAFDRCCRKRARSDRGTPRCGLGGLRLR
jgi:hypothetical protein